MQKVLDWCEEHQPFIEWAALAIAALLLIRRWLLMFLIWPDSSIYLTAAMNFVRHGTFFIYANFPSRIFLPQVEIYSDYPPGFPLFLAPFYFLLRSPISTAAAAQSVALLAFVIAARGAAKALRFPPLWTITALFFFAFFQTFHTIFASLLNEALYIALSLAAFQFSLLVAENPANRRRWAAALLCVLASAGVRWNGLANGAFLLFPIFSAWKTSPKRENIIRLALAGCATLAPTPLWLLRNSFYLHKSTGLHDFSRSFELMTWEKARVPFIHIADRWGFGHLWIALALMAFAISPWLLIRFRISALHYWMLLAGTLAQFIVILALTLMVSVTPVDDRYLSPAYTFFTFLLLFSSLAYLQLWSSLRRWFPAFALVGTCLCLIKFLASSSGLIHDFSPRLPPEYFLWQELNGRKEVARSTHYFSDDDFVHQLFIEKPQRIIYGDQALWPGLAQMIRASGGPFLFVLHPGSEVQLFVAKAFPEMKQERIGEFLVYFP